MLHTAITRARQVRRTGQSGFTLIELLIVIVILGVLASIVVFSVKGITNKGDAAACKATVSEIDTAYEAYVADNHPSATTALAVSSLTDYFHGTPPTTVTDSAGTAHTITSVATADAVACDAAPAAAG